MFSMTKTIIKSFFRKSVTDLRDIRSKTYADAYRGQIAIDLESCIFCGQCQRRCPADVIRVNRAEKLWAIDRSGCVQCASCVEVCPKKCLLMKSEAPASRFKKGEEVFQNA